MRKLLVVCIAFAFVAGCNSGPNVVPVTGILTYKGKPIRNVHLDFYPESGGRPSWGQTDSDGRFTLEYDPQHKGALVGKHKVFAKMGSAGEVIPGERPTPTMEMAELLDKYSASNSKVFVEISPGTKELKLEWD